MISRSLLARQWVSDHLQQLGGAVKEMLTAPLLDRVDRRARVAAPVVPRTMLVIVPDAAGDYVLMRDILASLSRSPQFRDHRKTLFGNALFRSLAEAFDREIYDDFIWFDRYRLRFDMTYRSGVMREISARGFEVCLYPSHSRCYYWGDTIVRGAGGVERIGSVGDTTNMRGMLKRRADRFYTRLIPVDRGILFEFERNRRFLAHLCSGVTLPERPSIDASRIPLPAGVPGTYGVIFPGAGVAERRWPADRFARVARHLVEQCSLPVVIAGGGEERAVGERLKQEAGVGGIVNLAGETDLPQLARVIASARILVSNDTVAVHLAASVGTPFVCVSNGNHFGRFVPYPPSIFDKGFYAFPPEVTANMDDPDRLARLFRIRSTIPISGVSTDAVISLVDRCLSLS